MKLNTTLLKVYLKNGDIYVITKDKTDDLYDIVDNHLIKHDFEYGGWFLFKRWVDVDVDLGEIAEIREK